MLSEMAERVYNLFPEDQAPYNKSWTEMKDKLEKALEDKYGDQLWTESVARARLGIAMHLAKWGGLVRTAIAAAAAASMQARDERERMANGIPEELRGLTLEEMVERMKRKFGEEFESVELWKKWLAREKKLGDWVQMKNKMAIELEDEAIEGPSTKQASTMLLRCLDAAEPRDQLEDGICDEAYNYTESCLECEQEEGQSWVEDLIEYTRPAWVWVLISVLVVLTAGSLFLLYVCRCRGRATLHRKAKHAAVVGEKLPGNMLGERPAWTS